MGKERRLKNLKSGQVFRNSTLIPVSQVDKSNIPEHVTLSAAKNRLVCRVCKQEVMEPYAIRHCKDCWGIEYNSFGEIPFTPPPEAFEFYEKYRKGKEVTLESEVERLRKGVQQGQIEQPAGKTELRTRLEGMEPENLEQDKIQPVEQPSEKQQTEEQQAEKPARQRDTSKIYPDTPKPKHTGKPQVRGGPGKHWGHHEPVLRQIVK